MNIKYKDFSAEDKILFVLEYFCYILSILSLLSMLFVLSKGSNIGTIALFFISLVLIGCGIDARFSRDSHILKHKSYKLETSKNNNKLLKYN